MDKKTLFGLVVLVIAIAGFIISQTQAAGTFKVIFNLSGILVIFLIYLLFFRKKS